MKFNNIAKLLILITFTICVLVFTKTTVNNIKDIRTLNSKIDSIINNNSNINYSYAHIPTFEN